MKSTLLNPTAVSSVLSGNSVSPAIITELTDLFLALAWNLAHRASDATEISGGKQELFFAPLDSSVRFKQGQKPTQANECNLSVTSFVLQFLVSRLAREGNVSDPEHLFLSPLSAELQTILRGSSFGNKTPLITEFNSAIKQNFVQRRTSMLPCKDYWELKPVFAVRAINFLSNRKDWVRVVTRTMYREHAKLQGHNLKLGLGLVTMHRRSA